MAAFLSDEVSVATATATKVVDAEVFTRRVFIADNTGNSRVAFTSADAPTGAVLIRLANSGALDFPLPAGQELWVYQASGAPTNVNLLVTAG